MCLITHHKIPEILEEDLTVYKILSENLISKYWHFKYEFNQLYETDFSFVDKNNLSDWKYFDLIEAVALTKALNKDLYSLKDLKEDGVLICIAEGFHSATTTKRLRLFDEAYKFSYIQYEIFTCTVPKGATIYRGYTDLIVSNQIIIHKTV